MHVGLSIKMGEVDYQLALLLQHQFEQELKRSKECNSDLKLARELQEQFQKEYDIEKPKQSLVYSEKQIKKSTKSLTDPSWEVVDPTPDIHILFMAFNERFFWKKLVAVCVSWSKRMTTCAGICSYQGRGGLCSITLSEPLLKLRPRKDLVETLLHEMIHAYLFVTHNNRDRDGHGPEFHKHMYRINSEAGTNITVYHDFHDEVRLYQQHWWRCDGPCQKWKPYFGMVRRAMNRAPGPQDRWWGEHSRRCDGNFIKVKEPEKPQKKSTKSSSSKENKNPKEDIRKFIPALNTNNATKNKSPVISNIHTITNTKSESKVSTVIPSKTNNIFGFSNLNGSFSSSSKGISNTSKTKGAVRNSSNTIVINKTQKTSNTAPDTESKPDNIAISYQGRTLTDNINSNNLDYSVVRNHWLNKFPNSTVSNGVKRGLSQDSNGKQNKVPKLSQNISSSSSAILITEGTSEAECPVCMKQVSIVQLNDHVDNCLQIHNDKNEKECIICGKNIAVDEYEKHVKICIEETFQDDVFENSQEADSTKCGFCEKNVLTKNYHNHLSTCLRNFNSNSEKQDVVDLTCDNSEKQCGVCEKMIPAEVYDVHAEKCLLKMYDDMETNYGSKKEEMVDCLACGKNTMKSELALHLEDCMGLSKVFEDDNEPKEEIPKECNGEKLYNCPFCMELVSDIQMNSHIDICLNVKHDSLEIERDKSIIRESLGSSEELLTFDF